MGPFQCPETRWPGWEHASPCSAQKPCQGLWLLASSTALLAPFCKFQPHSVSYPQPWACCLLESDMCHQQSMSLQEMHGLPVLPLYCFQLPMYRCTGSRCSLHLTGWMMLKLSYVKCQRFSQETEHTFGRWVPAACSATRTADVCKWKETMVLFLMLLPFQGQR